MVQKAAGTTVRRKVGREQESKDKPEGARTRWKLRGHAGMPVCLSAFSYTFDDVGYLQEKPVSCATVLHRLAQKSGKLREEIQQESEELWAQLLPQVLQQLSCRAQKWLLLNFCLPNFMQILIEANANVETYRERNSGKLGSSLREIETAQSQNSFLYYLVTYFIPSNAFSL